MPVTDAMPATLAPILRQQAEMGRRLTALEQRVDQLQVDVALCATIGRALAVLQARLDYIGKELQAVEQTLGVNPQGEHETVAARLAALSARRALSVEDAALEAVRRLGGPTA